MTNTSHTIVFWMCFQVRHDITGLHPRRNQAETGSEQVYADSQKWQDIGVIKLLPDERFVAELLNPLSDQDSMLTNNGTHLNKIVTDLHAGENPQNLQAHDFHVQFALPDVL